MKFFLVVSDKHQEGTSYVYGPFDTANERAQFQVSHFPNGCGRIVHPINSYGFINPKD